MSFQEDAARMRGEVIEKLTVGAGLFARGLDALGDALHRAAQGFESLASVIENQIDAQVPLEMESDDWDPDPEDLEDMEYEDQEEGEPYIPPVSAEPPPIIPPPGPDYVGPGPVSSPAPPNP